MWPTESRIPDIICGTAMLSAPLYLPQLRTRPSRFETKKQHFNNTNSMNENIRWALYIILIALLSYCVKQY